MPRHTGQGVLPRAVAVANVGKAGLFSDSGHYVVVAEAGSSFLSVLDPYLYPGKFDKPGRRGKVTLNGNVAYVSPEELVGQTIFRVEGLSEDPQGHPLPDYFVRLGLGENPVQRVKTYLEATILVQAGLGIAAIPGGMEGKLARDVSVFSIEGDSFRIRTVALRLLPPVSVAADHFFQVIRQDPERVKQGV